MPCLYLILTVDYPLRFRNEAQLTNSGGPTIADPPSNPVPAPAPTSPPPVSVYCRSPIFTSPMIDRPGPTYSSAIPPGTVMRSGQTPATPDAQCSHRHPQEWARVKLRILSPTIAHYNV